MESNHVPARLAHYSSSGESAQPPRRTQPQAQSIASPRKSKDLLSLRDTFRVVLGLINVGRNEDSADVCIERPHGVCRTVSQAWR